MSNNLHVQAAHKEMADIVAVISSRSANNNGAAATLMQANQELESRVATLEADNKRLTEELAKRPPAPAVPAAPDASADCDIIDTHMGRQCRTCGGNDYGGSLCTTDGQRGHP